MKTQHLLTTGVLAALMTSAQAVTLATDIQNSGATFGDVQGVAIDFDSTDTAGNTATPALMDGTSYYINDITFRVDSSHANFGATADVFLGVYTTMTLTGDLSGFLGTSTSAVTITAGGGTNATTWNFSNPAITVTSATDPGAGTDQRYFVFQSGTTAVTTLGAAGNITVPVKRAGTAYASSLSGIIRTTGVAGPLTNRSPDFTATITVVPEPSTGALLGLAGLALILRRRK